jgi:predicted MFS family arabinose efflux permease
MFAAGMVFGPAGGGILYARFGFATPFLVAAGLQLVTLLLTITMLPESRPRPSEKERVGLDDVLASFGKPRLARILWQKFAVALALYGWFAVIALYLQRQLGFSLTQTDYLFSCFAVFNVFVNVFVVGRVSTRLGDRNMSNVGLMTLVLGFALVPFVHDISLLACYMILSAFGMALTNAGITALISNTASDEEQGTVLGTSSSLDSLSGFLAPPVSTGILGALGPRFAGIESFTLAALALVMGLRNARVERASAGSADGAPGATPEAETLKIADG